MILPPWMPPMYGCSVLPLTEALSLFPLRCLTSRSQLQLLNTKSRDLAGFCTDLCRLNVHEESLVAVNASIFQTALVTIQLNLFSRTKDSYHKHMPVHCLPIPPGVEQVICQVLLRRFCTLTTWLLRTFRYFRM
jgi:hypothetical protein